MAQQPENPFANQSSSSPAKQHAEASRKGRSQSPINRFTPFIFTGTGRQLFGIQFLNIILIVLTLGVWTPWARVRKRRFFYNNTRILGDGLDYLATGFDLFKGWIVVTILLLIFYALPVLGVPFLQEGASLALLLSYPWALNRSLRFMPAIWHGVTSGLITMVAISARCGFSLPCHCLVSCRGAPDATGFKAMREYMANGHSRCRPFQYCGSLASIMAPGQNGSLDSSLA